jgi:MFS family permease
MISKVQRRWSVLASAAWWPAVPVLAIQLVSGIWYMPQLSFFPIYLEEELLLAPVLISALVSVGQVAGMVAGVVSGILSDSLGSKWVLVLGLAGATVASTAFLTQSPGLVAALWLVNGMAVGFHTLGGSSYLTKVADARYLGVLSSLYEFFLTFGGALGNPIAGRMLDTRGFGAFGLVAVILIGATMVGTVFVLPRLSRGRPSESVAGKGTVYGSIQVFRRPVVVLLILLRFLPTVYYGMAGVLVPLLVNRMAGSKTVVAIYASTSLVVASLAQLAAGRAADRWGRRWPTIFAYATLTAAGVGLAATATQLWGVFAFGVLGNGAAWALSALMLCLVPDAVPAEEHGRVLGFQHAAWSVGMIVGSMLGGALVRIAAGLPFITAALLNIASIALTMSFFRRTADRSATPRAEPGAA